MFFMIGVIIFLLKLSVFNQVFAVNEISASMCETREKEKNKIIEDCKNMASCNKDDKRAFKDVINLINIQEGHNLIVRSCYKDTYQKNVDETEFYYASRIIEKGLENEIYSSEMKTLCPQNPALKKLYLCVKYNKMKKNIYGDQYNYIALDRPYDVGENDKSKESLIDTDYSLVKFFHQCNISSEKMCSVNIFDGK